MKFGTTESWLTSQLFFFFFSIFVLIVVLSCILPKFFLSIYYMIKFLFSHFMLFAVYLLIIFVDRILILEVSIWFLFLQTLIIQILKSFSVVWINCTLVLVFMFETDTCQMTPVNCIFSFVFSRFHISAYFFRCDLGVGFGRSPC